MVRYTAGSRTAVNEKWAADRAVTDHGDLTVKIRNRWTENFPDENAYHRRQGYLPKLVTKMCEVLTTFESSVVKLNCSDRSATVPFMGISHSELFPGFNRYTTE